jgi:hypothetical protein
MTIDLFSTLGGRVTCIQCNALSKRTKTRCRAPAVKGKTKCRFHGGCSTGPRTAEGRARISAANTLHGRETKAKRAEYRAGMAELRYLEEQMFALGMFPEGTKRTPGRKPGS